MNEESLKITMAIMPVTIVAAFIEGYLTRHTELPVPLRVMVIVLSAAFIISYFIVLPWLKGRKRRHDTVTADEQLSII